VSVTLPDGQSKHPLALSVKGLTYAFSEGAALFDGLSFDIREGEFVSLLAPSGIGKTTLFRLLAGLLAPQAGTIKLGAASGEPSDTRVKLGATSGEPSDTRVKLGATSVEPSETHVKLGAASGQHSDTSLKLGATSVESSETHIKLEATSVQSAAPRSDRSGRIGYMPQRDSLMPWRSVLDNAALGLELAGTPKREARRRVLELLPAFGLEGTEMKRPHELSGGMRQRVSFLRSMLGGGDLLLLDEPFSALDAMTRVSMQEWLLQVWEQHRKTILFITHDIDEALLLSDRVLVAKESPVTELHSLAVALPRPRTYETVLDSSFAALKRQALELLGKHNAGWGETGR
jgi:putative hydroxymethylpyrimidine transport system ATP-binding protein